MSKRRENNRKIYVVLLVLLFAVTSAFIGTLAKYATSDTVTDDTVAAKFGLNIPDSIDLFSDSYDNVDADVTGKKIIAPGTSGQSSFVVTGTSEVAYRVSANVSVVYSEEWNGYEPLLFSLNGDDWYDLADFQQRLSTALESEVMEPNEAYTSTHTIHWEWPFYVSAENDIKDTAMGVLAAGETVPNVVVNIEVTATQID